jgi:hypothetical protein
VLEVSTHKRRREQAQVRMRNFQKIFAEKFLELPKQQRDVMAQRTLSEYQSLFFKN